MTKVYCSHFLDWEVFSTLYFTVAYFDSYVITNNTLPFLWFNLCVLQLKVVGPVAVLGGMLQIFIFMFLCGILAMVYFESI